ncbi:hypothetical protein B0H13DRAFT_2324555 [Mycena leptocephala]|nr:hypothetical protein B0H13DRAFT_2324555 [Mycena leptocephala]
MQCVRPITPITLPPSASFVALCACRCIISPSVVQLCASLRSSSSLPRARRCVPSPIASQATSFTLIPATSVIFKCARRRRHSHHSIAHRAGITPRPASPPVADLIFLSSPALLDLHPVLMLPRCTVDAVLLARAVLPPWSPYTKV